MAAWLSVLVLVLIPVLLIALYRVVEPPITPLMWLRSTEGLGRVQVWLPLEQIPLTVRATAIASEDGDFCQHSGIDWAAMRGAVQRHEAGAKLAGASTLTMQLVRSLFLWPGRSFVRKGIEMFHAPVADTLWGKRRTLELYLNLAEWGPGIYGIEAAAQYWYGRSVPQLELEQVARLYAILPNPVNWDPRSDDSEHAARWQRILRRQPRVLLGVDDPCVDPQTFAVLEALDAEPNVRAPESYPDLELHPVPNPQVDSDAALGPEPDVTQPDR